AGERAAHRHDFGDEIGMPFGELARKNSAEAPADQHDLLAITVAYPPHPVFQEREVSFRRAEIEAKPPAFDLVPGTLKAAGHVARPQRVRAEARKQHHHPRVLAARQDEPRPENPHDRLEPGRELTP